MSYQQEWKNKNMAEIRAKYKKEFVEDFRTACKKLGVKQSEIIRSAAEEIIEKAKKSNSDRGR